MTNKKNGSTGAPVEPFDQASVGVYTFLMLQTGFLGLLSDWVSEQIAKDAAVMERVAQTFGLEKLLAQTGEPEKILGLFS